VPGSIRSPASAGTNALLAAGATVARDLDDVLTAVGLGGVRQPLRRPSLRPVEPPDPLGRAVLAALGWEPLTFEELVRRTGLDLAPLAAQVAALEGQGFLVRSDGWIERTATRHG
jgi:DNA processing protein